MSAEKHSDLIFRVPCNVEGHEDDWIEIDTSAWTLAEYRQLYYLAYPASLRLYVEVYSTDWHLTGDRGLVPHPRRQAEGATPPREPTHADWMAAYKQLGDEGMRLVDWLAISPLQALEQRLDVSKKSSAGGEGAGEA